MSKKNIVISAINLTNAGPLSILRECLAYLADNLSDQFHIIALVYKKSLINEKNITCYEFPDSKRSWLKRIYYEYIHFHKLSRDFKPYLWFSLHDMTPRVEAELRAVYLHNAAPFYRLSLLEAFWDIKFTLFNLFYKYLYRINIKKNDYIVVQQNWFRKKIKESYAVDNVIVSHPTVALKQVKEQKTKTKKKQGNTKFIYPAYPRFFKNMEVIGDACRILETGKTGKFEVDLTINGSENRYARSIFKRYGSQKQLKFLGIVSRREVFALYEEADCMIFPSRLETWGLPLTEFKHYDKPILAADYDYAREAVGDYKKVKYFNPNDSRELSMLMSDVIEDDLSLDGQRAIAIEEPFSSNWKELFDMLLFGHTETMGGKGKNDKEK